MGKWVYDYHDIDEKWDSLQETIGKLYEELDDLEDMLVNLEVSEDNNSCAYDVKLAFIKELDLKLINRIENLRLSFAMDIDFKPENLKVRTSHQTHQEYIDSCLKKLNEEFGTLDTSEVDK